MQRLTFGQVAEEYERSRPAYPDALVDDLVALAPLQGRRAVEAGAGTGKATRLFAARGVPVLAVEPSAEMARVARRTCEQFPGVEVVESDFEDWRPGDERFGLVFSAQAWHWIDPEQSFPRAREALADGGLLAAFWNRPAWPEAPLRDELSAVYRELAPGMATDSPMHPDNRTQLDDAQWTEMVLAGGGFDRPEARVYSASQEYSAAECVALLSTMSSMRMLDPAVRVALCDAVRATIDRHGGTVTLDMAPLACLAWAA